MTMAHRISESNTVLPPRDQAVSTIFPTLPSTTGYYITTQRSHHHPNKHYPFSQTRDNFYLAAKNGLDAHITWTDLQHQSVHKLILDQLLIEAETGLQQLFLDEDDIKKYLGVIENRVKNKQTGSAWQREFCARHHSDMRTMTLTYLKNQRTNQPVHSWDYETKSTC